MSPKAGARILFASGLALTGWLLGAVLSTPASADEQTPVAPATSVVQPSDEAGSGKSTTPEKSTSDSGPAETTKPVEATETTKAETPAQEPAPASSEEPEATVEEQAVSSANSVPEPSKKTAKPQAANGLLGGLIGGVLDLVTNTVGGVVETVGGVVGGIGEHVVAPIVTPAPCCGGGAPVILPGTGDMLDPVFGGGSGESAGGSVTIAVPAKNIATGTPAPITPDPRPFVPAETPTPAAAPQNHRVTLPIRVKLDAQPAVAAPIESDTHASPDGGGSGGGGGLPNTPVAPLAPTTSAQPGHDHSGGGRGPLAVLDSGIPATQLKLLGTGCDHEGERTGREAALPATSPD
ncbi:hypothetical protein ACFQ05_14770 [Amycolatopsis umgeniensis]|uniref:Cytoskeletal protein RodZ n=1 Tax=Amycolatopsis umgeniensis TaxID=336628 RepID=A0A841B5H9_9PSEU|nr:hypothetical protein [Amycolatopsis umgeniensis]MBB5854567.1 cytoskeletal protein RodZ [Amycolatopsis umgeniensis]